MFNELKFIFLIVDNYYNNSYRKEFPNDLISDNVRYNISYLCFFFGVGLNSSMIVMDLIGENHHHFFKKVENFIKINQKKWKRKIEKGKIIKTNFDESVYELDIKFIPCNGHMSILSHYIRNLYQIVKFIEDQDEKVIPYKRKFEYVSTLRTQLSTHEQLLLYYNAISVLGKPWLEKELIEKYCIIKSTPLPLANFYKTPESWLPEKNSFGKVMFEWTEIKNRINLLGSE